jgi:outer membrane lipoprotein-sorting protein
LRTDQCHHCEARLRAYLDGELGRQEGERVREHLAGCGACRASLAAITQVSRLVGSLPAEVEPPPHFGPNLQLRLAGLRPGAARVRQRAWRPRWSRRYALAAVTVAGTVVALIIGAPPRLGAQDLVGKVQQSWQQLQSYSCRFVTEGIVGGKPRRFEQSQWFSRPNLFRLVTNKHYPQQVYLERDRVTTFIPGANWRGKRVAITRPRRAREEGLPFPFGAEWPVSYDVTMDALVRELRAQEGGELLGTEEVLGKRCYVLKFRVQRPGERQPTHSMVWVDQDSFLPLRMKTYHDTANQTVSTAVDLRTNIMAPSETFHFAPGPDTFHVFGEVDPFVFALGLPRPRPPAFDADPVGAGRGEILKRAASVAFTPLAPQELPKGYVLVRARASGYPPKGPVLVGGRAARGRWLDAYWIDNSTGAVIKLYEQPARTAPPLEMSEGMAVSLGDGSEGQVRWREVRQPIRIEYVTWNVHGTRLALAAAGIGRDEALRMAASMAPVTPSTEPQQGHEGETRVAHGH